jgi:hypothetical protein
LYIVRGRASRCRITSWRRILGRRAGHRAWRCVRRHIGRCVGHRMRRCVGCRVRSHIRCCLGCRVRRYVGRRVGCRVRRWARCRVRRHIGCRIWLRRIRGGCGRGRGIGSSCVKARGRRKRKRFVRCHIRRRIRRHICRGSATFGAKPSLIRHFPTTLGAKHRGPPFLLALYSEKDIQQSALVIHRTV